MAGVEFPHLSLTHKGLNYHDNKYTPIDTPNLFLWEAFYGGSTVKFWSRTL